MDGTMQIIRKSRELSARAAEVIPGGVNSPVRAFKSVGGTPRIIARGEGAWLIDIDDNRYLDFCCSWGPLILGHTNQQVAEAVIKQVSLALCFGSSSELECELA